MLHLLTPRIPMTSNLRDSLVCSSSICAHLPISKGLSNLVPISPSLVRRINHTLARTNANLAPWNQSQSIPILIRRINPNLVPNSQICILLQRISPKPFHINPNLVPKNQSQPCFIESTSTLLQPPTTATPKGSAKRCPCPGAKRQADRPTDREALRAGEQTKQEPLKTRHHPARNDNARS